jgi:hypothetical protein
VQVGVFKKDQYSRLNRNFNYFESMKQRVEQESATTIARCWRRYKVTLTQNSKLSNRLRLTTNLALGLRRRMGVYLAAGLDAKRKRRDRKGSQLRSDFGSAQFIVRSKLSKRGL